MCSATTPSTETDLLDAFITDNVPGGALLMPITGPSGVGKSHIIRWLDAQLQRSAKRDRLHIIRIPKSASLRTVVELILAPLADDPRYAKAREDFTRAVAEVNIKDAVVIFRGHLENALSAKRERLLGELREHPERRNLKALIGHADMLPRLFSDAALDQHFVENVLSRVVSRALRGRSEGAEGDETFSHARSNPQGGRQLHVCDDSRDEDGSIRAGLKGAVRFVQVNGKRWSYSQADDDYVASAAIIDHLVAQLKPMLVEDAKAQASTLGRALITQSRIAGLAPPVRPTGPDAVLESLFAEPPPRDTQAFEENWDKLHQSVLGSIGAKPARTVLQSELLARIACFQGDRGGMPFAVDIVRLLEAAGADATAGETTDGLPEEVRAFIRPIADNRLCGQLTAVIAKLHTFRSQIGDFIDERFDKAAFITDLQKIVRLLGVTGTTPANLTMTIKEYERRLTEFQQSAIIELVAKAGAMRESW